MDKTPVYKFSYEYAHAHGETEQCIISNRTNIACRDMIEKVITAHYHNNSLDTVAAVGEVVAQFGYERMLYVLANTVQTMEWDGRVSHGNKEWAKSVSIAPEGGERASSYLITRINPGLLDMFIQQARHEYLLSLPLSRGDIKEEAQRILEKLQAAQEPNSPNGTHYMVQVSPDFMRRARTKDTDRLISILPFQTLSLSTLEGSKGVYALIHRDENRFQKLVLRRPSVRKRLEEKADTTIVLKTTNKKSKGQDR